MCSNFKCPLCGYYLLEASVSSKHKLSCTNSSCSFTSVLSDVVDISYKNRTGAVKGLSNLAPYKFTFDNIPCVSFESFIQSLRIKEPEMQKELCSLPALFCYSIMLDLNDWRKNKLVYWKGKQIERLSDDYLLLISNAYDALFNQSYIFRHLLKLTQGKILMHSIGCIHKTETLLTPKEYIYQLERLRNLL